METANTLLKNPPTPELNEKLAILEAQDLLSNYKLSSTIHFGCRPQTNTDILSSPLTHPIPESRQDKLMILGTLAADIKDEFEDLFDFASRFGDELKYFAAIICYQHYNKDICYCERWRDFVVKYSGKREAVIPLLEEYQKLQSAETDRRIQLQKASRAAAQT